ncbi:MAG: outer membrane protein assembly factor BamA [Campylobacterales bacterium]|nr:outer membrane protein assembly factor BamA [Campylobacterales bacterium]
MIKKTSLLWMSIGSILIAQNITKIEYDGLHSLSPNTIAEISGIKVGDTLSESKIKESVKNLLEQKYFQDVKAETKSGGVVVYHFVEKPAIANAQITGYGSDEESKKLIEAMGLKRGELLDDAKMQKAKEVLQAKLAQDGIYDASVDVKSEVVGEGSVSLTFDVKKGEKVKISNLVFNGIDALSESDLETNLVNKEEEFLGFLPFRNDGVANLSQLENDVFRIKDTYMKHGYIDAQVSKPRVEVDSKNRATIEYNIIEGNRYKVGDISIIQSVEGLDSNVLYEGLSLKKGKYFNIDKMRKDIVYLQEQTANLGYAFANVSPQMGKSGTDVINIQYVITPGTKVTINDVLISGNNETQDSVVRRYIYLAPGDQFSQTDLKDSKNALGRTGFFEKYDIQTQKLTDDKMNLLVNVKEAPTGSFSIGGGYGSYEGFMVNGSISDKNIFGTGIDTSIGIDYSQRSTNYNLHLANPRIWDSLYSLSMDLYKKEYDYDNDGYQIDQTGGSLTVGREFMRHFYIYGGITYSDNQSDVTDISGNELYKLLYSDKYKKAAGVLGVKFDNTDDYYVPRSGFIASLGVEVATLNGELNDDHKKPENGGYTDFGDFVKFNGRFGAYYGLRDLIDYDLILRYKARANWLNATDGYVPVAERLLMGGIGSVRGYETYSISPEILDGTEYRRVGGTKSFSNSIEASIPVSEEAKIRMAFFLDYGIIGSDDFYGRSYDNIDRASGGVAVEWFSPFGPINFIFAKAINPQDRDETSSFEFSMGTKF